LSAILPLGLAILPSPWPVWIGVGLLGILAGRQENRNRSDRVSAAAASPWEPAESRTWSGTGLLRMTGWATAARGDRWRAPARLLDAPAQYINEISPAPGPGEGLMVTGKGEGPAPGSILAANLELRIPDFGRIPGGFDHRRFLTGRGLSWVGKARSWQVIQAGDPVAVWSGRLAVPIRDHVLESLAEILPPREAALAGAVLLGVRGPDHRVLGATFTDLGLAHLFAVSGLHVGILLGLFTLPGKLLGLGPGSRYLPLLFILPGYIFLTGMPGSVVRAAGLGLLALATPYLGTRSQPLHLLGILFWAGCVWEPLQVLDTGLQLSYLAAGGILSVSGRTNGFHFFRNRAAGILATGLAVSVAAQWFTLPVVAASFGRISLLSPLANLVVVPLFGVAVWLAAGGVIVDLLFPWAAQSLGAGAWLMFRLLAVGVEAVAGYSGGWPLGLPVPRVPTLAVWGFLTTVGLLFLVVRNASGSRPRWVAPSLVLILGAGLWVMGPLSRSLVHFDGATLWTFDVDQGDCSILVLPDGWRIMIDTGGVMGRPGPSAESRLGRNVIPYLVRQGVKNLDAVVLTHGHLDHTGGAHVLARSLAVGEWYCGGRAHRAVGDSLALVRSPGPGRHLLHRVGSWEVALIVPEPPRGLHPNENDFSLVTVLSHEGQPLAVLSGDLEKEGEGELLAAGLAPEGVQVWKAGHHGSATSGSRPFLAALDPRIVVISCGVGNRYGHPSHGPYVTGADTVPILRTDLAGSVRLRWSSRGHLLDSSLLLPGVP